MLHLVGKQGPGKPTATIGARRAHYERDKLERLVRLHRGVYCDEEDLNDLSSFLRRNALRIANYLYRGAALTHSSAFLKGVVEKAVDPKAPDHESNFKLFLAGSYNHEVQIRYLTIVHSDTLNRGRIHQFCQAMIDGQDKQFGPLGLKCLSDEVVYLQQFGRKRYHPERFLSDKRQHELRDVLLEKHGEELIGRLVTVADEIGDFNLELAGAISHVRAFGATQRLGDRVVIAGSTAPSAEGGDYSAAGAAGAKEDAVNNAFEFEFGWYGRPIGRIVNNGVAWNFSFKEGWMLPLSIGKSRPGLMPSFVSNLFPEGYLQDAMSARLGTGQGMNAGVMGESERYLSNIAIVKDVERLKQLPLDALSGRIEHVNDEAHVFQGRMSGMPYAGPAFIGDLNRMVTDIGMPRFSGQQPKIPCHLDQDGVLSPSLNTPFTHILKLAGLYRDPHSLRGAVEWASMSLARGGGVKTCDFTMLELESGSLAYVCERFDIPTSEDDMRMIYSEDFCAVMGLAPSAKYTVDDGYESLIGEFKKHCSPNRQDDEQMFRQIYANYLLENGDFHLKNASVVRVASPTLDSFRSTRLAPAYDIMNTRYFADFPHPPDYRETMALDFRGKQSGWTLDDYVAMGEKLGITPERIEVLMFETAHGIAQTAHRLAANLPAILERHPKAKEVVCDLLERAVRFCHEDFPDIALLDAKALSAVAMPSKPAPEEADEPEMIREVRRALRMR